MPKSLKPGDLVTPPTQQLYRVVATGSMPNDPDTPALLLEWDEGGRTYRCWSPASEFTRVAVH